MREQSGYSEALNVHNAFTISIVVGGSVLLACILFIGVYLFFEEIKYRRKRESKHTRTQDNLPIVDLTGVSPESKFGPGHVSKTTKVVGRHQVPNTETSSEKPPFDPEMTKPDLAAIVEKVAARGKHHASSDDLVYSVADTVVDMGIPREVLQHDGPTTRLDFFKAAPEDTDYFNKIKDMHDGI